MNSTLKSRDCDTLLALRFTQLEVSFYVVSFSASLPFT
jgi:hypothetical protein